MRKIIKCLLFSVLLFCASFNAFSQDSVLETNTRGNLQTIISRVLNADNSTAAGWAHKNSNELDFTDFSPQQIEYLKGFVINVAVFKISLDTAFSLFEPESGGNDYYNQHRGNMIFDASDGFYRTTLSNPEVIPVVPSGVIGKSNARPKAFIWNTNNYKNYAQAMLAKADAANNIHAAMCLDKSYTHAELYQILQYGIKSAEYVYEETPNGFVDSETMKTRNTIIAELKAKRFAKSCRRIGSVEEESRIENERRETENRERLARIPLIESRIRELKASLDQLDKDYKRLSRQAFNEERQAGIYDQLARISIGSVIYMQKSRSARIYANDTRRRADNVKNKINEINQEIESLERELNQLRKVID